MNGASNDENILNSIEQVDKNYTIFLPRTSKGRQNRFFHSLHSISESKYYFRNSSINAPTHQQQATNNANDSLLLVRSPASFEVQIYPLQQLPVGHQDAANEIAGSPLPGHGRSSGQFSATAVPYFLQYKPPKKPVLSLERKRG